MRKSIVLSTAQVHALQQGRVTVRVEAKCKFKAVYASACLHGKWHESYTTIPKHIIDWYMKEIAKPPYTVGQRLYVRESWMPTSSFGLCNGYLYQANEKQNAVVFESTTEYPKWHSPVTMPKTAVRLWATVASIKVEKADAWEWVVELERSNEQ